MSARQNDIVTTEGGAAELCRRISALEAMDLAKLRKMWIRLVKTNLHLRLSADLIRRGIAHRLQETAQGRLRPQVLRKLAVASKISAEALPAAELKIGTTLVREWHGRTHTVRVLEDGFDYGGKRYPSLTSIARDITGAAWSGPRFFGIGSARTVFGQREAVANG